MTSGVPDHAHFANWLEKPTSPVRIVTEVGNVTITVSDLDKSLAFYRTLGFESTGPSTLPPLGPLGPELSTLTAAPDAKVRY